MCEPCVCVSVCARARLEEGALISGPLTPLTPNQRPRHRQAAVILDATSVARIPWHVPPVPSYHSASGDAHRQPVGLAIRYSNNMWGKEAKRCVCVVGGGEGDGGAIETVCHWNGGNL